MIDIMHDIETLGTAPGSVILTIGACAFDRLTGDIHGKFYINITRDSCEEVGLTVDPKTLEWWEQQSEAAKAALYTEEAVPLREALQQYSDWMVSMREKDTNQELYIWGNDNTFDNVLLERAYRTCKMIEPWAYWEGRSVRTLVDLGKVLFGFIPKHHLPRQGVHHNALDDAIYQAAYCTVIFQKLYAAKEAAQQATG